ncbi:MAG: SCO family protein, partial [Gammaproteobacteria bacterium]
MKPAALLFSLIAGWLLATSAFAQPANAPTGPLPGDSVYNLDASLVDQDGKVLRFADGRGQPRLVSMFYSSCKFVCPMIIDTLRRTERSLPDVERKCLD